MKLSAWLSSQMSGQCSFHHNFLFCLAAGKSSQKVIVCTLIPEKVKWEKKIMHLRKRKITVYSIIHNHFLYVRMLFFSSWVILKKMTDIDSSSEAIVTYHFFLKAFTDHFHSPCYVDSSFPGSNYSQYHFSHSI